MVYSFNKLVEFNIEVSNKKQHVNMAQDIETDVSNTTLCIDMISNKNFLYRYETTQYLQTNAFY